MKNTCKVLDQLRAYESRNVLFTEPDGSWPIVWEHARGVQVWDAEGRPYLDLTAAFGVASAGHANPRVVRAGRNQMARLLHAMGDVHPHAQKALLARDLSRLTFERWTAPKEKGTRRKAKPPSLTGKVIFNNSGFEAVESALKTARLATGRKGIIAFKGAYHGLGYGALNATHREHFRGPFRDQLGAFGHFVPFPTREENLPKLEQALHTRLQRHPVGAILAEPVQARGGINVPPAGFLPLLRRLCDAHGALLILDEIYTGFGRTGAWFACEHSGVVPDLVCLGKALTGGFPLSACVGRADVMDAAWPASTGEAIHTSTYLGHPVGCAMALAQIEELRRLKLIPRSAKLGAWLLGHLRSMEAEDLKIEARGLGLMLGLELRRGNGSPAGTEAMTLIKRLLRRGFILLPEGGHGNVISLTPPLTITKRQLWPFLMALEEYLLRP
jgi:4-aminobutyrate aminotransferase-like enzyme